MPNFTVTLERTITIRQRAEISVEAADFGAAELIARQMAREGSFAPDPRWFSDQRDEGRTVVVDIEEEVVGGHQSDPARRAA
ncbi:hypothetical protein MWN34_06320 [Ancylobacter sp. 6x-1]|uniref:Uncharacterized protein n=1 Tax=Ancylobacter crimeensis TaxID=2579147 RepID=A0ABT0D996_9HYPH|nr:hypothetical protein [Ancylobacter crimeensis]MCK0196525.1 hypothetical protein [Ancylobacter crimeensis]